MSRLSDQLPEVAEMAYSLVEVTDETLAWFSPDQEAKVLEQLGAMIVSPGLLMERQSVIAERVSAKDDRQSMIAERVSTMDDRQSGFMERQPVITECLDRIEDTTTPKSVLEQSNLDLTITHKQQGTRTLCSHSAMDKE